MARSSRFLRVIGFILVAFLTLGHSAARAADSATVTFTLDFPKSDPEHYSISVKSDGTALYTCSAKISDESEDRENYELEFKFSEGNRARIFDLAAQAHYFAGKVDSGNKKLAFTGAKKLVYKDGEREVSASYNYSPQPVIQQLTTLFQNVAATLEFGRRLAHFRRYQKLALDDELKKMEAQARSGNLSELQAVQPILLEIRDDPAVINVVRAKAERIMEMGKLATATH